MIRTLFVVVLVTVMFCAVSVTASAHGDVRVANQHIEIGPGDSAGFPTGVHYHRLIGRVSATGPVRVEMISDRTGEIFVGTEAADLIQLNALLRCCDEDPGYSPFTFIIHNETADGVSARVRARLVHDDFAVIADNAEDFAWESIPIIGGIWGLVLWRAHRRKQYLSGLSRSGRLFAVLVILTIAIATFGFVRYGNDMVTGLLAGLSEIPVVPTNPIVSSTSLLLALMGIAWGTSGVWWVRASGSVPRAQWLMFGVVLLVPVVLAALLIGRTYDTTWVPVFASLSAALPLLVTMHARSSLALQSVSFDDQVAIESSQVSPDSDSLDRERR